ncbi:MAG: hypothetical protein LVQ63_00070 [Thermoplasmatales archaeon]|nr:hypothetical protein [Thermoplasmatales archaeon]
MKSEINKYIPTRAEISAMKAVIKLQGSSINELGSFIEKSQEWTSQVVSKLESKGFVTTNRKGMTKTVVPSSTGFATSLSELVQSEPFVPWENLLSGSRLAILLAATTGEKNFVSDLNRTTSWRAKKELRMHGISPLMIANKEMTDQKVVKFVREYAEHIGVQFIHGSLPRDAIILWKSWFECIFKYPLGENKNFPKEINNIQPTAFTAFPRYGLQFLTNEAFYYFSSSENKLTKNDIVLHTLLVDPGNVTNVTYAVLFILKNYRKSEMRQLKVDALKYQLEGLVDQIITYIRSSGNVRTSYFPKWDEMSEIAREYRIEVQMWTQP